MATDSMEMDDPLVNIKENKKNADETPTCNGDVKDGEEYMDCGNQDESVKEVDSHSKESEEKKETTEEPEKVKINGDCDPNSSEENKTSGENAVEMEKENKPTEEKQADATAKDETSNSAADKSEGKPSIVEPPTKKPAPVENEVSTKKMNGEVPPTMDVAKKVSSGSKKKLSKVTQVLKAAKAPNVSLRPIAQLLFDIGMDLTRQTVYRDLIKIQKKKDAMDKLEDKEKEQLALLGESYDSLLEKNESFLNESLQCPHCTYKTDSINVMELHTEYAHDQENNSFTCGICGTITKVAQGFLYHMEAVHNRKGRLVMKHAFFVCPYCPYESNSRVTFQKHMDRCTRMFRESHNLTPLAPDCDIPLKMVNPREKKPLKVASKPVPPTKPAVPTVPKPPLTKPSIVPFSIRDKAQPTSKFPVQHPQQNKVSKSSSLLNNIRAPPPRPQIPAVPAPPVMSAPVSVSQPQVSSQSGAAPLVQMNGQWYRLTTIGAQQFLLPAPAPSVNQMPANRPQIIVQNQPSVPLPQGQGKSGSFEVCEICGGFVKDRDSLRIHFYWAHKVDIHKDVFKAQEAPLLCPICQKSSKHMRFWTYQGLSRHRSTEHKNAGTNLSPVGADRKLEPNGLMKEIPKQCVVCAHIYQNTTTPQQYWTHMEVHGITPAKLFLLRKCLICGVAINEPKKLERHLLTSHASLFDKHVLAAGKAVHASETNAKDVIKSPPKSKPLVVCDMCKISFQSEVIYQRHLDVVHTFKCTRCYQKLSSRDVLMRHFHESHGNEKDACSICNQLIKIGRSMVRHLKSEHVQACSVPVTRLPKAEAVKYLEKLGRSIDEVTPSKRSRGTKRKSCSSSNADVIMIDLDASPPPKVERVQIREESGSSAKKQILEVDGEEIVVEIRQNPHSSDSEEGTDDETTQSAIILDDSRSETNISERSHSVEKVKDKESNAEEERSEIILDSSENQDKENEEPGNGEKNDEIELSDGDDIMEMKVTTTPMTDSGKAAAAAENEDVLCEDDISSDENDDEVEESEKEGQGSINISSDDDQEVMETD